MHPLQTHPSCSFHHVAVGRECISYRAFFSITSLEVMFPHASLVLRENRPDTSLFSFCNDSTMYLLCVYSTVAVVRAHVSALLY